MKSTHDTIEEVVEEFHYYRTRTKAEVTTWLRASLLRIHQAALERAVEAVPRKASGWGAEEKLRAEGFNACRAATLKALTELEQSITKKE